MNRKNLFLVFILMGVLVIGVSLVSADLCKNSKGYYEDCDKWSKTTYDKYEKPKYNTFNQADPDKPIFKGPYGNYRYEMYRNGDYNPNQWYQPRYSGGYGSGPYFSGGNYGYGGYGGYYGGYDGGYYGGGYGYSPLVYSWFW